MPCPWGYVWTVTSKRSAIGPLPDELVERVLAYVEQSTDLIGITDDQGNLVYANPATGPSSASGRSRSST